MARDRRHKPNPADSGEAALLAAIAAPAAQAPGPGPLLAAVSGGGDSVALLRLLLRLAPARGWRLTVAHVDHGLRPDSAEDARFVAELAAGLGLPCLVRLVEVDRGGGLSPEEAARLARRRALAEMAGQAGAAFIALAHSADDQAETLLMRLFSGTGPTGLAGMRALAAPWWRPLLAVRRSALRQYLTALGQPWREDPTNAELGPARNRLRGLVLPLVEERVNPRAVQALGRLAELAAQEEEHWDSWCARALRRHAWREGPSVCLETDHLLALDQAARRRLLRAAVGQILENGQHLLAPHVEQLLDLALGRPGRRLNLPGGLGADRERAFFRKDCLRLHAGEPPRGFQARLDGPGWVRLPALGLWLAAEIRQGPPRLAARGPEAWLPLAKVSWPLTISHPAPGARFQPLGAPGSRRLSRFLMDIKAPAWWRQRTVLVRDRQGPWWAGPWSVDERARGQNRPEPGDSGPWLRLRLVDRANPRLYTHIFKNGPFPRARSAPSAAQHV